MSNLTFRPNKNPKILFYISFLKSNCKRFHEVVVDHSKALGV